MDEEDKKSIAVIGSEEFTLGFKLAGVQKTFTPENYEEKIQELMETDKIGIIVAKQQDLDKLPNRIQSKVEEAVDPVVVPLSEEAEATGLEKQIKQVIGVDPS